MTKRAKARTAGLRSVSRGDGLWVVDDATGQEHAMGPVSAAVWRAADGERGLDGLLEAARAVDATADDRLLWQVLDGLADAGLLMTRLAPPAPVVDRRAVLRTMGVAAGALVFAPSLTEAQEVRPGEQQRDQLQQERRAKSSEREAKSSERVAKNTHMGQEQAQKQARPTGTVTFRSHFGKYLVAEGDLALANRARAAEWERWQLADGPNGTVSLRSHAGKYLVAEPSGAVFANRPRAAQWESWKLIRHADGTISLQSHHGKYLSAQPDGTLVANRGAIQAWEKFRMEPVGKPR